MVGVCLHDALVEGILAHAFHTLGIGKAGGYDTVSLFGNIFSVQYGVCQPLAIKKIFIRLLYRREILVDHERNAALRLGNCYGWQ